MFAIVRTGGKQLKVEVGQKVSVEKIDAKIGSEFVLDQVLMVGEGDKVSLGTPLLSGAAVKTVMTRTVTRAEQLWATGTGTFASPGALTFEGLIDWQTASWVRA